MSANPAVLSTDLIGRLHGLKPRSGKIIVNGCTFSTPNRCRPGAAREAGYHDRMSRCLSCCWSLSLCSTRASCQVAKTEVFSRAGV